MDYRSYLKSAMNQIAENKSAIFLGQAVVYPGTFMFPTLEEIPLNQRLELPVCESFQMQLTLGLALKGMVPISIFPRMNFLALALGDLINLIDKFSLLSVDQNYKVIIRTAIGPDKPIHPGYQHVADFSRELETLIPNIAVHLLDDKLRIKEEYEIAMKDMKVKTHLLIEFGNRYND